MPREQLSAAELPNALPSIWLDRVRAQPAFAITLDNRFEFPQETIGRFSQLFDQWAQAGRAATIDSSDDGVIRIRSRGVVVNLTRGEIVIVATDTGTVEAVPGQRHRLRYETETPEPFTALCEKILADAPEILPHCLSRRTERSVLRMAVVAICWLERSSLPPGVDRFLEHLGEPWQTKPAMCDAQLLVSLRSDDSVEERCHHRLELNEIDRPGAVNLRLDWQRINRKPVPLDLARVPMLWRSSAREAFSYFSRFASGELAYGEKS